MSTFYCAVSLLKAPSYTLTTQEPLSLLAVQTLQLLVMAFTAELYLF